MESKKVKEQLSQIYAKKITRSNELVWDIFQKDYLSNGESQKTTKAQTIWDEKDMNYQNGTNEIKALFDGKGVFSFPKPTFLIKRLIELSLESDEIILDFFAGAGTTAQAVFEMNEQNSYNRKFILVQLPEPCPVVSDAFKAGFRNIAEICKERVRRVISKLNEADAGKMDLGSKQTQDRGFRVFKLVESNFKPWNANIPADGEALAKQLEMHVEHIRDSRTQEDILYELLLKSGFPITTPIEKLNLAGKEVFSIDGGIFLICLEKALTLELIRAMAARKPERIVCLDDGFAGNDQLKANAVQIFKTKGVTSFKTV